MQLRLREDLNKVSLKPALSDASAVRVYARAPEETVEVSVRQPPAESAAYDAEKYVEEGVEERVRDGEAQSVEDHLDHFPADGSEQPDPTPRENRAPGSREELVVPAQTVNDLRRDRNQHERRNEVRQFVVERNGLEQAPREPRRVQQDAEDHQQCLLSARHLRTSSGYFVAVTTTGFVALPRPDEYGRR